MDIHMAQKLAALNQQYASQPQAYATDVAGQQLPFTARTTDKLDALVNHAREIASRLYSLKLRLIGEEPIGVADGKMGREPAAPQCFVDRTRDQINALDAALCEIENLTARLDNGL